MRILARMWQFVAAFRRALILAVCLTGMMTFLGMAPPILMRYIIDEVVGLGKWDQASSIFVAFLAVNFLAAAGTYWNYLTMDRVANGLQERLKGVRAVRAFGSEGREAAAFASGTRDVLHTTLESTALSASFSGTSGLLSGLGQTIIYCMGCYYVIHGQMTYGDVAAFSAFASRVLSPAVRFTEVSNFCRAPL